MPAGTATRGSVTAATDTPHPPRTILLVGDHAAVRAGISLVLERAGFAIAGATTSAQEARALARAHRPDVVVVDLALGDDACVDLAADLLARRPGLGVLFHTGVADAATLHLARATGVRGFALKPAGADELVRAVTVVAGGGTYVDPRLEELAGPPRVLTPRERTVLARLAEGLTGEQIAAELGLSPETIRTHVRNAMEKLGARTRAHAVVLALQRGEIRA